jgi:subtilisin family serine protease
LRGTLSAMLGGAAVALAGISVHAEAAAPGSDPGMGGSSQVVGIVVKLQDDPVVSYQGTLKGLTATAKGMRGESRPNGRDPAVRAYRAHLAQRFDAFEADTRAAVPTALITYRFDIVLGGVAMRVPEDDIARVARLPGVKAVYRDPPLRLLTDSSPQFIGAPPLWGRLQGHERAGEGVVVGVLDTGVWPEHPSFADPDPSGRPYPPPPTLPASCDFAGGTNPGPSFTCNHKLIGAYRFMASYDQCVADSRCAAGGDFTSARDSEGHGTHTASTAAGNAKVDAQVFGIDRKDVSGVAPRAYVIAYKVCGPDFCFGSDSIAALQQAILDGVDVINFSVAGGIDPYDDVLELAFLDAYAAGVFVAASAGNEGPDADTANHRGPWLTSVAASTENRTFQTTLSVVGTDGAKLKLSGASITPGIGTARPVVNAADIGDRFCAATTPADLAGYIVVCERGGDVTRLEKSFNVAQRGAAGMVLFNSVEGEELLTDNHSIPSLHISKSAGDALAGFLEAHQGATGSFPASVARNARGDVVARFSSRGGTASTLGVSKPDITAPGVQILAGHTPQPANPADPAGQLFQVIAGTSMSSPHVAGAAALLKNLHPDWTPGQIKSALMTTASTAGLVNDDGVTPSTPFDAGSGRVNLSGIPSVPLVFDAPASDYVDHADDLWNVNTPSIYVPDIAPNLLSVQRTPQSVVTANTTWKLIVVPDPRPGLAVTVPSTLVVPAGGSTSFDIEIDKSGIPAGEARHAVLQLVSNSVTLHMPITAAGVVARPDLIVTAVTAPSTGTSGASMTSSATIKNVGSATAAAFYFQVYLSRNDATVSPDDTPYWFCDIASLAPDASASCTFTGVIPVDPGTYYLVVKADDGGAVGESNEKNNVGAAGPITIN